MKDISEGLSPATSSMLAANGVPEMVDNTPIAPSPRNMDLELCGVGPMSEELPLERPRFTSMQTISEV